MLKVFEKSPEQREKEQRERNFYNRLVKGRPELVCPTYVITGDGKVIDTDQLTEEQILSFVRQGIISGLEDEKNKKFDQDGYIGPLKEVIKLMDAVKYHYKNPSYEGMKVIIELCDNDNPSVKALASDTFAVFNTRLHEIEIITKYRKEIKGDFSKSTREDKLKTIDTLIALEKERNTQKGLKK